MYIFEINYIFGISRSRASKWYIICSYSKSLKFFQTSENGLNFAYFAKIAHKIAKPKYFPNIFYDSDSPINSLFRRYIICWGNLSLSKIIGGGAPRTAASFYSAKLCTCIQLRMTKHPSRKVMNRELKHQDAVMRRRRSFWKFSFQTGSMISEAWYYLNRHLANVRRLFMTASCCLSSLISDI